MYCEQKSGGFLFGWQRAVRDSLDLSATATAVLLVLATYADMDGGSCFPGQKRLAKGSKKSERVVRRALKEAEAAGLIVRQRRQVGMSRTSDLYQLTLPGCGKAAAEADAHVQSKRTPTSASALDAHVRVPAQQEKTTQRDHLSNARARARGRGKAVKRRSEPRAAERRFLLLWSAVMVGIEAPKAWALGGASYAEMTTALAWTINSKQQSSRGKEPIHNTAGYFVTLLGAVVYGGEKTVRTWSQDDLWGLMVTGLDPDKYAAKASRA